MKILKPHFVVFPFLLLFLLLLLIFHSFVVIHIRVTSIPISDTHIISFLNHTSTKIRHRKPNAILCAHREEIRHDHQAAVN